MTSSLSGNDFRDAIATLMRAAGYNIRTEILIAGKIVDVLATRKTRFAVEKIAIEAKDYESNLPINETQQFIFDYGPVVRTGEIDRAILVTRKDLTPHGKQAVESASRDHLLHFTWENFQREIFSPDDYLRSLIREYDEAGISKYYLSPKTDNGDDVRGIVRAWLSEERAPPLVILGGYGIGKSTFAFTLVREVAEASLNDPTARIPIFIPLGEIADENSLDGLVGKLLASRYRVDGYHYNLFRQLNRLGRLLIVFDGFDEMKYGMTFPAFQRQCDRLFEFQEGQARILLLGRPNAFATDQEFRAIIKGRLPTGTGGEIRRPGRPECRDINLAGFSENQAREFVSRYFDWIATRQERPLTWINDRLRILLSIRFQTLIRRPVHAQMQCQVALDSDSNLDDIDEFTLYGLLPVPKTPS